ncbi:uncharacterized protein LOC110700662 isoform X2 [Chenopodium quinoa]|uniref:uncharacterized protein LOC110700662 isoform X2 n=1 Tax=Chenopodium quinoa TaxID=63459 RepID=UPI000B78BCF1|nr:uncharacterized protein LOC110700662 isoform X2 [Chenopodium quinoa]
MFRFLRLETEFSRCYLHQVTLIWVAMTPIRMVDWLAETFKKNGDIDLRNNRQALRRLTKAVEKAKIELLTLTHISIRQVNVCKYFFTGLCLQTSFWILLKLSMVCFDNLPFITSTLDRKEREREGGGGRGRGGKRGIRGRLGEKRKGHTVRREVSGERERKRGRERHKG